MLTGVEKSKFTVLFIIIFGALSFPDVFIKTAAALYSLEHRLDTFTAVPRSTEI